MFFVFIILFESRDLMKGIILAGGSGTRLYPLTYSLSKQLLPIYDKPMIYYPLSVLMLAGIKDVLIISTRQDIPRFQQLLGNGSQIGIKLSYAIQEEPKGLAEAFIIGETFIGNDRVCFMLGDNILYGHHLETYMKQAKNRQNGATIFSYNVKDPERFGVVEYDAQQRVISIEEKPTYPKSNQAITGLYFFDHHVVQIAKQVTPSARGELEITDVLQAYMQRNELHVQMLGRGFTWLDTGTHHSLFEAGQFIETIEKRQQLKVGCIEEIAYKKGYISKEQLLRLARPLKKNNYGQYLLQLAEVENESVERPLLMK